MKKFKILVCALLPILLLTGCGGAESLHPSISENLDSFVTDYSDYKEREYKYTTDYNAIKTSDIYNTGYENSGILLLYGSDTNHFRVYSLYHNKFITEDEYATATATFSVQASPMVTYLGSYIYTIRDTTEQRCEIYDFFGHTILIERYDEAKGKYVYKAYGNDEVHETTYLWNPANISFTIKYTDNAKNLTYFKTNIPFISGYMLVDYNTGVISGVDSIDFGSESGIKIGDKYIGEDITDLSFLGLKGYTAHSNASGTILSIFKNNKYVHTINLSSYDKTIYINGNIIAQTVRLTGSDVETYTFIDSTTTKYVLNSYVISIKDGSIKETKLDYLINSSKSVRNSKGVVTKSWIKGNRINTKAKTIDLLNPISYLIDSEGKILEDVGTINLSSLVKLDSNHYYDSTSKIMYNSKFEELYSLSDFARVNFYYDAKLIVVSVKVTSTIYNYGIINYDGTVVAPIKYERATKIRDNHILLQYYDEEGELWYGSFKIENGKLNKEPVFAFKFQSGITHLAGYDDFLFIHWDEKLYFVTYCGAVEEISYKYEDIDSRTDFGYTFYFSAGIFENYIVRLQNTESGYRTYVKINDGAFPFDAITNNDALSLIKA